MTVTSNIARLRGRLAELAGAGWEARVRLVAVSKYASVEAVREAHSAGLREFAESRVQELERKQAELADLAGVRWHFIGHLQTNKVRKVAGRVELIQSLDSIRLAEALQRECESRGCRQQVLIQVRTTDEPSKTGLEPSECETLVARLRELDGLELAGLMTMGPREGGAAGARRSFRLLQELRGGVEAALGPGAAGSLLSMGMSQDWEVALEEGSNMVRLGSSIFD